MVPIVLDNCGSCAWLSAPRARINVAGMLFVPIVLENRCSCAIKELLVQLDILRNRLIIVLTQSG